MKNKELITVSVVVGAPIEKVAAGRRYWRISRSMWRLKPNGGDK